MRSITEDSVVEIVRLRIFGHVDTLGNDDSNVALAAAVVTQAIDDLRSADRRARASARRFLSWGLWQPDITPWASLLHLDRTRFLAVLGEAIQRSAADTRGRPIFTRNTGDSTCAH